MGPRVDGTSPAPLYDYEANLSDTYVVQGETSLGEIADKLHLDKGALAEANPQIKDGKLLPLQVINLPQCSVPMPAQAEHSTAVVGKPHGLPPGPVGDTVTTSAMRANLSAAKSDTDEKARQATAHELIDKAAALGLGPYGLGRLSGTLATLPESEFKRQTAQIREALNTGDPQRAMYAIEVANSATQAVTAHGGGQPIQAKFAEKADGYHLDFDRPVSKEQAAALIFQGGKVPDGARLEQGPGNSWVVKVANDMDARQNTLRHFNSHMETVGYRPSSDPALGPERDLTFTWVVGGAHKPAPVSNRKDIDNDFGFKILRHYDLDPGKAPVAQVKSALGTGKGHGYEVAFEKPMTKEQVMDKLFEKGRFGKNDVQLKAVPHEPSTVWEVHIIGVDANSSIKRPYVAAFADAVIHTKASQRPDIPAGIQSYIDAKKVPPNAIKHPPDVYTWEQDGHIAYVKTDGKNYYEGEVTRLSGDKASDNTIRYFVMEKGMPPHEGWKKFIEHWDDINRQMIAAFAFTLAAAGGMPGRNPDAAGEAVAVARRPRIGNKMEGELDAEATGATRNATHAPEAPVAGGAKPGEPTVVPNEKPVVSPKQGGGGPLDHTAPAPGGPHDSTAPGANVKPSKGGQETVDTNSPAPAAKPKTRDYDPKADPNNVINDKTEVTVKTPNGEKKMTRGEYYQRHENARQWLAEKRIHADLPKGDPGPRSWIQEAADKFGLEPNWFTHGPFDRPI